MIWWWKCLLDLRNDENMVDKNLYDVPPNSHSLNLAYFINQIEVIAKLAMWVEEYMWKVLNKKISLFCQNIQLVSCHKKDFENKVMTFPKNLNGLKGWFK